MTSTRRRRDIFSICRVRKDGFPLGRWRLNVLNRPFPKGASGTPYAMPDGEMLFEMEAKAADQAWRVDCLSSAGSGIVEIQTPIRDHTAV
jgi:hypothetical protein